MADKMADERVTVDAPIMDDDPNIVRSPFCDHVANLVVPEITLTDLLFECLDMNEEELNDDDWVVDVIKGTSYKFRDIKPMTRKIASKLTRMGFKKGDVLYFVTYDVAFIYMIEFAVWRCGGAVRGCFQKEQTEEFERQMRETRARFVLCDPVTSASVKMAAGRLGWPVQLLSIGHVEGATDVEQAIQKEDGSAFPQDVKIDVKEDVISIPNTSGSTGLPKGVIHTHFNLVAMAASFGAPAKIIQRTSMGRSLMGMAANYAVGSLLQIVNSILFGCTFLSISSFDQSTFLKQILKYKPESIILFPYVANWFIRLPELEEFDWSFLKHILCGGSVLDLAAAKIIEKRFPSANLTQVYASSEALGVSSSTLDTNPLPSLESEKIAGLKFKKVGEELHLSNGPLLPMVKAKIMDRVKGCSVGRMSQGTIWVKSPYLMKGYLNVTCEKAETSENVNGWLDTGDIGFFDEDGHLYILERKSSMFKYFMHHVSPSELEAVIGEHPAVLSVGVIGVPDPHTTHVARAYVVLKPGCKATEEEIKNYVAERKIFYKHLHGGVSFVKCLPMSRGGKLDRSVLLGMSIAENKSKGGPSC